jgi:hypothetical protein
MGEAVLWVYFSLFLPHKQYFCSQARIKHKAGTEQHRNVTICTDLESYLLKAVFNFDIVGQVESCDFLRISLPVTSFVTEERSRGRSSIRRPATGSELLRVPSERRGKFRAGTDRIGATYFAVRAASLNKQRWILQTRLCSGKKTGNLRRTQCCVLQI